MRYNLYFTAILAKGLPVNIIRYITRRLGAICGLDVILEWVVIMMSGIAIFGLLTPLSRP